MKNHKRKHITNIYLWELEGSPQEVADFILSRVPKDAINPQLIEERDLYEERNYLELYDWVPMTKKEIQDEKNKRKEQEAIREQRERDYYKQLKKKFEK